LLAPRSRSFFRGQDTSRAAPSTIFRIDRVGGRFAHDCRTIREAAERFLSRRMISNYFVESPSCAFIGKVGQRRRRQSHRKPGNADGSPTRFGRFDELHRRSANCSFRYRPSLDREGRSLSFPCFNVLSALQFSWAFWTRGPAPSPPEQG
jgi:hypothetical protein